MIQRAERLARARIVSAALIASSCGAPQEQRPPVPPEKREELAMLVYGAEFASEHRRCPPPLVRPDGSRDPHVYLDLFSQFGWESAPEENRIMRLKQAFDEGCTVELTRRLFIRA